MFEEFRKYTFSLSTIKNNFVAFFIFNPPKLTHIDISYPNLIFFMIIHSALSSTCYFLSRALSINLLRVFADFVGQLFSFFKIFSVIAVCLVVLSMVYSSFLGDGYFSFSFLYALYHSYVHLPFSIFLANFNMFRSFSMLPIAISVIQGIVSHYLFTSVLESTKEGSDGYKCRISTIGLNILFCYFVTSILFN